MKIQVQYPPMMGMQITSTLDIPERAKLCEIEKRAFVRFLDFFPRGYEGLGHLTLFHRDVEILNDDQLRPFLADDACFEAWFSKCLRPNEQPSTNVDPHFPIPSKGGACFPACVSNYIAPSEPPLFNIDSHIQVWGGV